MSSRMISVKIHKPSISLLKSNKIYEKERTVHNYLLSKYSRFEYSYSLVCINNLIFNEQCRIVARFKDFLILDDMTEFLRRFYTKKELKKRLNKIFNFYESYSKIFPNYMILAENKYLYKNIRKKQKMIDAVNQIKKEEEENRKSLKKEDKGEVVIFNESIQESINRYRPSGASFLFNSIISGFMKNNTSTNNDSNWNSLISISMNNQNPINYKLMNSKNKNELDRQYSNSFEQEINEATLNSENSLVNVIQLLNKKYDNSFADNNNNQIGQLYINNNNKYNYNDQINNNNKDIHQNNEKIENKTIVKKDTINKKINRINTINENNQINKKIEKFINNNTNCNICTPPKVISPVNKQLVKRHNHQKSALNNNKKFISHKQAVSVSNNNGNNTIKIINNINNIIINDANINKEMVININTNYFELNNTNLNSLNKINNNNIDVKMNMNKKHKNLLFKKIKINSKSKSKNKNNSITKQEEALLSKKIYTNNYDQTAFINKTLEEKKMNPYSNQILNFVNRHYSTNSNNIENSNIINNNVINIHNSTASHINTSKSNKKKIIKNNNIRGITEYRSIDINNIANNGSINKNKSKCNYAKKESNKKAITIDVENYDKNRKSQNKQRKKLEIFFGTDAKRTANKQIFNKKLQNEKKINILNTDGNINYNIYSNATNNYYNNTEINDNSHSINLNNKNEFTAIKSSQIRSKLNKKIMPGKQKTYSLQINNKNKNNFFSSFNNNNKISKELDSIKKNKIIGNNIMINEHVKNYTQVNLDSDNQKVRKISAYKESKEISEKKYNKISAKEMKEKYHKFMMGNKIIHGSYDTSNRLHIFKKFTSLYNHTNVNSNTINNTTDILNKKTLDIKSPYKFSIINTPASKMMSNASNIKNFNITGNSYKNYEKSSHKAKMPFQKKEGTLTYKKNKHLLYKVSGLKQHILISDTNNKKMKYIKK